MFEIIPSGTRIDFLRHFRVAVALSGLVLIAGLVSLFIKGPNYGIDFAGGTLVQVRFQQSVAIEQIRSALTGVAQRDFTVQDFGGDSDEFLIRMPEADPDLEEGLPFQIRTALANTFGGEGSFEVLRVETVGPRIGEQLRQRGLLAVIAATIMMGAYIALRFELRFGLGAGVALVHDTLLTLGVLSLGNIELDLTVVAALLTVVGYSVNDTVIVSDRIRENMHESRRETVREIVNRSINQTLSRTVMTTGTAMLVILALFFLGGEVIHGFAYTLLTGFLVGTYSSIFIASPVVVYLGAGKESSRGRGWSMPRSE